MKRLLIGLTSIAFLLTACSLPFGSSRIPTPTITSSPARVTIKVYFTNLANYLAGTEPYETAVTRKLPVSHTIPETVLNELFLGPTSFEKEQGLAVYLSGAKGYSKLTIEDGVARVYLTGDCNSKGATYTIANLLDTNLKQFPEVKWVKVYDPTGQTETPDGQSGSIPICLEP